MTAPLNRNCPSCGDVVQAVSVDTGNSREIRCGYCGLTLERQPMLPQSPAATAGAVAAPLIALAEDSKLLRTIVSQHLRLRFPRAEIIVGVDGKEALTGIVQALLVGPRRGVAILDLQMPRLNGLAVAVALRSIEAALERKPPLPVIFFSAVKINDALKAAMADANPAAYLHKNAGDDPEAMLKRLEEVMAVVIRRGYES